MTDTERERINAICEIAGVSDIEDLSDGFHTFAQLYYQRMILSAVIVKQNKNKSWKSLRHENGELCFGGGWFIVGIDTPEGSYTYHYETKYFDLFDCEIIDYGKHWDGHTEKDVTRLLALPSAQQDVTDTNVGDMINRQAAISRAVTITMFGRDIRVVGVSELESLPSAQPDLDEWCTDCKEYDSEKHHCPRYNRVIREALNGAEPRKPGRWNFIGEDMFECTSCGVVYTTEQLNGLRNYDTDPYAPKFCPNCGADMRGTRNDTT